MRYTCALGAHCLYLNEGERKALVEILSCAKSDLEEGVEINTPNNPTEANRQRLLAKVADAAVKALKRGDPK